MTTKRIIKFICLMAVTFLMGYLSYLSILQQNPSNILPYAIVVIIVWSNFLNSKAKEKRKAREEEGNLRANLPQNIKIWRKILSILICLLVFGPFLISFLAGTVASFFNCELNEGGVNPCVIGGFDFGETLYDMFAMFWLTILTFPLGGLLLIVREILTYSFKPR